MFDDFSIPFPPDRGDGGPLTLRELITRIVIHEVEAFRQRQERRLLPQVLSEAALQSGLERGKVDSGASEIKQNVDEEQAVAAALQAFEDGLYLVFVDEIEQRDLDAPVYLQDDSRVMFVRLTFLAGA